MKIACLVDIPLLPESTVGSALQLIDLLRAANLLARLRLGQQAPALGWRLLDAEGRLLNGLGGKGDAPAPFAAYQDTPAGPEVAVARRVVVLTALHAPDIPALRAIVARHPGLIRAIGQAVDAGGLVATLGNGAWLAAASGRLDGHPVALPWYYIAGFRHDFAHVPVAVEGDFVDRAPWLSSASPQSLPMIAIAIVRAGLGRELAQVCARAFLPDAARSRAAAASAALIPVTRNSTLARAVAWMEEHLALPYSLDAVASAAAVSPRTLLRHFQQQLGQSPLDCLHALRCERAQVLLEITLESVPSIAAACGYTDPTAFRRVFARYSGTTPADYRARHALRAPRARWRVDPRRLAPRP